MTNELAKLFGAIDAYRADAERERDVRHPYDGYVSELDGGRFEVAAAGALIDVVDDRERAETLLAEHCTGRSRWYVDREGTATRIG